MDFVLWTGLSAEREIKKNMGVEGGAKILKFLVFFFNFIFFVFGCVLIGVGAWVLVDSGDYVTLSSTVPYATGPKVLIAAGALIAVVAFLGCCGAWKENRCMLVIFFICLLVILALELAAGILGYKNRDEVEETLDKDFIEELQQHYNESGSEGTTKVIDTLQRKEKCCGWYNHTDWYRSRVGGVHHTVPDSCCKEEKEGCGAKDDLSLLYKEGCKMKLVDLVKNKLKYVGAIAVAIIVVQILGMIFAAVLICKIGDGSTYA